MEERIIMDRRTMKILASDSKRAIMKHLEKSQLTLTDLSKTMNMSFSTVKEHLDDLSSAGLIEQKDEGRKWKYYMLTRAGKQLVSPVEKRIVFLMGLSILAVVLSSWNMADKFFQPTRMMAAEKALPMLSIGASGMGDVAAPAASNAMQAAGSFPFIELALFGISVFVMGICLGYIIKSGFLSRRIYKK
jgi:predicted transcriptional regulator